MQNKTEDYRLLTDEALVIKICSHNPAAFEEIYRRYNRRLFAYLMRMFNGKTDKAQDFLQTVFLKIIENANRFDQCYKFSVWIFGIAHNLCLNEFRRLKKRNTTNIDNYEFVSDIKNDAEVQLDTIFFKKALLKELAKYEKEKQSIFLLRFQEDLSVKEISSIMNCPEGTVKSRLFYLIHDLAQKLKHFNPNNEVFDNE